MMLTDRGAGLFNCPKIDSSPLRQKLPFSKRSTCRKCSFFESRGEVSRDLRYIYEKCVFINHKMRAEIPQLSYIPK
jgi:hypothetical protein